MNWNKKILGTKIGIWGHYVLLTAIVMLYFQFLGFDSIIKIIGLYFAISIGDILIHKIIGID